MHRLMKIIIKMNKITMRLNHDDDGRIEYSYKFQLYFEFLISQHATVYHCKLGSNAIKSEFIYFPWTCVVVILFYITDTKV